MCDDPARSVTTPEFMSARAQRFTSYLERCAGDARMANNVNVLLIAPGSSIDWHNAAAVLPANFQAINCYLNFSS